MMYLQIVGSTVRLRLGHSPHRATVCTFAEVLAGEVGSVFGKEVLDSLRAAVSGTSEPAPVKETKQQDMKSSDV